MSTLTIVSILRSVVAHQWRTVATTGRRLLDNGPRGAATSPGMSPRRAVAVIAAVVLAVGVILAVTSLSVGTGSDAVECGSAFHPWYVDADILDIRARAGLDDRPLSGSYVAQCEDEVGARRLVAYPLAGVGALALLFVWLTGRHETRWDAEKRPADEGAV